MAEGYESHLIFLALPEVEMAIYRISLRVKLGGHNIPEKIIWRRFTTGLMNFFHLYREGGRFLMVIFWQFYTELPPFGRKRFYAFLLKDL
jgi:hypothetical protein